MRGAGGYWLARFYFQRGLGLAYLIAFLVALNQFRPLLGERGLLPVTHYVRQVSFKEAPSLFLFFPNDTALAAVAWTGILFSCLAVTGLSDRYGTGFSMLVWAMLWALYLSFVNVGQTFYGFGWESILLEIGFFTIFLGARDSTPQAIMIWILRWVLFRIIFGAGLIKLRGDPCWRDLSCLNYHYETQPMPNPLSWYLHWAPEWAHRAGVGFNHFVELIVPFGYFAPQPVSSIAGLFTIVFQGFIMASGNLSWLNFLTIVLALTTLDDRVFAALLPIRPPELRAPGTVWKVTTILVAMLVAYLSINPIRNMLSRRQVMNLSFNPLHLVGTYGAFGSVTRVRYEVVVEGTDETELTPSTKWQEYEFKGKPGDPSRSPPQIAPYHLRLDWLMWFAAMSEYRQHPWFVHFLEKLLRADAAALSLLGTNPFPKEGPHYVRAELYEYHFTSPEERKKTGQWWTRQRVGRYFPPVSLDSPAFQDMLDRQEWW